MPVREAATGAGLGGTKLTRVLSGSLDISDRYSPLWAIDCAVDGFAAHVETPPTAQLKLLVEADAAGCQQPQIFAHVAVFGPAHVRQRQLGGAEDQVEIAERVEIAEIGALILLIAMVVEARE